MSRDLSWRAALKCLRIRIAVIPVGQIDPKEFSKYHAHFISVSSIKLNSIKPFNDAFMKRLGSLEGEIYMDFYDIQTADMDMADFDEFQLCRHTFGVIGIGTECDDEAIEEFKRRVDTFKRNPLERCFIFNNKDADVFGRRSGVISIPSEEDNYQKFLEPFAHELVISVLASFSRILGDFSHQSIIHSPRNLDDKIRNNSENRLHLRTAGRLAKLTGDLYLLSGAYTDAATILKNAVDETKLQADYVWHAAAQEVLQTALVLQEERNFILNIEKKDNVKVAASIPPIPWITIPEKLRDAAALYQKAHLSILAFDCFTTTSDILEYAACPFEAAMSLCQGWLYGKYLDLPDKLYAIALLINRFEKLGMRRKQAFFYRLLASILSENKDNVMAHVILANTFKDYGIVFNDRIIFGWNKLRISILKQAIKIVEIEGDYQLQRIYTCALLGYGIDLLENDEQVEIAKKLKVRQRISSHPTAAISRPIYCLIPIVKSISIADDTSVMWKGTLVNDTDCRDATFIYNPQNKRQKIISAVACNELIAVKIALSNPLAIPLEIINIHLKSQTVKIESEKISLVFPAWEQMQEITLFLIPLESGLLRIDCLECLIYGLKMQIRLDSALIFTVIPPQPVLKICNEPQCYDLTMIEGEKVQLTLKLVNMSEIDAKIVDIVFSSHEQDNENTQSEVFSLDFDREENSMIAKGKEYILSITITAKKEWRKGCMRLTYSSNMKTIVNTEDESNRSYIFTRDGIQTFSGTVKTGLSIGYFEVIPLKRTEFENTSVNEELEEDNGEVRYNHFGISSTNLCPKQDENECLVVMDLQNHLSQSISIHSTYFDFKIEQDTTKRFIFIMPLMAIPNSAKYKNELLQLIEMKLRGDLKISWKAEPFRVGHLVIPENIVSSTSLLNCVYPMPKFEVEMSNEGAIGIPHKISIKISFPVSLEPFMEGLFMFRCLPVIEISDDEYEDDVSEYLDLELSHSQILLTQPIFNHDLIMTAKQTCIVQILLHIERIHDGSLYPHQKPLCLSFK